MKRIFTLLLVSSSLMLCAQERPFWKEIKAFTTADSLNAPPRNAIVFVGSSSFRMWRDMAQAFPDHKVINRGFGGSSLPHAIEYADEIIIPYAPSQVVIYCGENDFMGKDVTSEIVTDRFVQLFDLLRKEIPRAGIVFVSMKPSPSRQHLMDEIAAAKKVILFAHAKDYHIVDRKGLTVIRDPYTVSVNNQTRFVVHKRFGGAVRRNTGIKHLITAAS